MAPDFHVCYPGDGKHPNYVTLNYWGLEKALDAFIVFNNTSANAVNIRIKGVEYINKVNSISSKEATCSVIFLCKIATPGVGIGNLYTTGEIVVSFRFGKNTEDQWILTSIIKTSKIKVNNEYLVKFTEQAQDLNFVAQ